MNNYIAIDQYGQVEYNLGQHPRKELLARCGRKHADRMYVEFADSVTHEDKHVGWVIAGRWFTIYTRMENKI